MPTSCSTWVGLRLTMCLPSLHTCKIRWPHRQESGWSQRSSSLAVGDRTNSSASPSGPGLGWGDKCACSPLCNEGVLGARPLDLLAVVRLGKSNIAPSILSLAQVELE